MNFYADPANDLPSPFKPKRCIFYTQGLKVYGQIPYILQRQLQAEFFSNNAPFMGGRLVGPTAEPNYTVIPYQRRDGQAHSQGAIAGLIKWLLEGKGFEWAVAADFEREICGWNVGQSESRTWIPAVTDDGQAEFIRLLAAGGTE